VLYVIVYVIGVAYAVFPVENAGILNVASSSRYPLHVHPVYHDSNVKLNVTGSSYLNEIGVLEEVVAPVVLTVPTHFTEATHLPAVIVKLLESLV
jgi:hypothetical protein